MRWILITLLGLQAATCGQKGPLTLPESTNRSSSNGSAQTTEIDRHTERAMQFTVVQTTVGPGV